MLVRGFTVVLLAQAAWCREQHGIAPVGRDGIASSTFDEDEGVDGSSPDFHNVIARDPTGVAAVHKAGLAAHHSTGASDEDPLLFRHRYASSDGTSGDVIYLEYEAKRHPNTVMLNDLNIELCEASANANDFASGVETLKLVLSDKTSAENLTSGAIIVGEVANCTLRKADGAQEPWRNTLRERIVRSSLKRAGVAGAVAATLKIAPAALNDVFEHAQIEYYHGTAANLQVARTKRLNSFAVRGHAVPEKYNDFASTEHILSEATTISAAARRALSPKRLEPMPEHKRQATISQKSNASDNKRQLDHYPNTDNKCSWDINRNYDYTLHVTGTRCSDQPPGAQMKQDDCFWENNGKAALKVGNEYTIAWTSSGSDSVEIFIQEWDGSWGSPEHCYDLSPYWIASQPHSGSWQTSPNTRTFTMPDLRTMACANDGWFGGYPEFTFVIQSRNDCHRGRWKSTFTVLYDQSVDSQSMTLQPSPTVQTFGSESAGASIECNDCKITGTADAHVLIRIDQYNPFAEAWAWGDLSFEANIDLKAQAWLSTNGWKSLGSKTVLDLACISPICFGGKVAGVDVKLGVMTKLVMNAEASFDARADVTYKRRAKSEGTIGLHTLGTVIVSKEVSDFAQVPLNDASTEPATLRLSLDATGRVGVHPSVYVGLFASVSTSGAAEAYMRVTAALYAQATFQFRTAINSEYILAPRDSSWCSNALIGCNDACSAVHDVSLSAVLYGRCVSVLRVLHGKRSGS